VSGREGREREKGCEEIEGTGKGEEGKENGDRPPTIFGLKVALGSVAGRKFLAPPYYSQRAVFASLRELSSLSTPST